MEMARLRSLKWWQFHHALWRYKYVVATMVILGAFISVLYTSRIPKQYRATASAMVDSFSNMSNPDYSGSSTDLSRAHKVLAESTPVRDKAVALSGLAPAQMSDPSFEARVDGLLIYFSVTDGDYEVAKKLANAWADTFITEIGLRAKSGSESQERSLSDQLKELQDQWDKAKNEMTEFFNRTKFDPERFATDPLHAEVSDYATKVRKAEEQLTTLDEELKIIGNPANDAATLVQLQHVKDDLTFGKRLEKFREYDAENEQVKLKFKEGLERQAAEEQLSLAKKQLQQSRDELMTALKLQHEVLDNERKDAKAKHDACKTKLDDLQKHQADYMTLKNKIENAKGSFEKVYDRWREAIITLRMNHNNVIKWEEAQDIKDPLPFKPNWRQNITVGVLLSFLLACVLVFGLEQIDDTVRTPKDLEERLGAVVLGAVPACGNTSMDREGYFLAKRQSASSAVDCMRGIHIGLEVGRKSGTQRGAFVITVTSAVPQDGKSFVTSNLGILFASLGRKVLVVDADLRKASLSKALDVANRDGFFEIVKNQKWTRDYALNGKTPGYYLLSAGHVAESVSESLHPETVSALLEQMRMEFDVIIFDTPPVLALPDACVLGQLSDVTVLVTRSRHTRMAQAERAAASLYAAKVKELVWVVNGIDSADAASETYGGGYGYGHGYGYGGGYGREKKSTTITPPSNPRRKKALAAFDEDEDEDEDDVSESN